LPYARTGRVRALAVTTTEPTALTPNLPTVASQGLPGYESRVVLGMFAPAKTPTAIIDQLNTHIVRAMIATDVKQRLFDSGVDVIAGSPTELVAVMQSE